LGYSDDALFKARIKHHMNGSGACLIRAINIAGIGWSVVRLWPYESGNFERELKKLKKAASFCPICNPKKKSIYAQTRNYGRNPRLRLR
jgi:hypothetical protein